MPVSVGRGLRSDVKRPIHLLETLHRWAACREGNESRRQMEETGGEGAGFVAREPAKIELSSMTSLTMRLRQRNCTKRYIGGWLKPNIDRATKDTDRAQGYMGDITGTCFGNRCTLGRGVRSDGYASRGRTGAVRTRRGERRR